MTQRTGKSSSKGGSGGAAGKKTAASTRGAAPKGSKAAPTTTAKKKAPANGAKAPAKDAAKTAAATSKATQATKMAPARDPRPARARVEEPEPAAPEQPRTDTGGLDGALAALAVALDKKALEPILLDVRELCSYCNYQLVLSGRSDRQVDAISEGIQLGLKQDDLRPISSEGLRSGQWALLDYGDFVVHVFHHPLREHYDLEGLWNDAPRVPIDVPAEARIRIDESY
jgi:ribosome-associated protein